LDETLCVLKHEDDGVAPVFARRLPEVAAAPAAAAKERGLSDLFEGDGRMPKDSAARFVPEEPDLDQLKAAAAGCTACPLHERGTQTVFGEGRARARVMLVGEQPGDQEDIKGRPFVGPAGQLLDWALQKAGIDREAAYVTNVVKHFKWVPRGKRRIHSKPSSLEIKACLPWLEAELLAVRPEVIVLLGATAAQALLGASFRVTRERGQFVRSNLAPHVMATVHPSSLLRIEDDTERKAAIKEFVRELQKVAKVLGEA
jgi:DNA polymerase